MQPLALAESVGVQAERKVDGGRSEVSLGRPSIFA